MDFCESVFDEFFGVSLLHQNGVANDVRSSRDGGNDFEFHKSKIPHSKRDEVDDVKFLNAHV